MVNKDEYNWPTRQIVCTKFKLSQAVILPASCVQTLFFTKFERNRTIRGRVIDDIAHFRRPVLGGGALSPDGSQGCVDQTSPNLATIHGDHGPKLRILFQG